jgi:hypothetical protein
MVIRHPLSSGLAGDRAVTAPKKTKAGKIAKKLKRTVGATRQKAFSIGLSLDAGV